MSEDAGQKEQPIPSAPQQDVITSEQKPGISRREFLKRAAAFTATLPVMRLLSTPQTAEAAQIKPPSPEAYVEDPIGERFKILREKVNSSSLLEIAPQPEYFGKNTLLQFLNDAEQSLRNFYSAEKRFSNELTQLRKLKRQQFGNPDIDVDNFIPFISDKRILERSIFSLEKLGWEKDSDRLGEQIAELLNRDGDIPPSLDTNWKETSESRRNPKNIARTWGGIGRRRDEEARVWQIIPSTLPTGEEHIAAVEIFKERQEEFLAKLPIPGLSVLIERPDPTKPGSGLTQGAFEFVPGQIPNIIMKISPETQPGFEEHESYVLAHEAGHGIHLSSNPQVMTYGTLEEAVKLALLQEEAALSNFFIKPEWLLGNKFIAGKYAIGRWVDGQNSALWFIDQSRTRKFSLEELDGLASLYPADRWLWPVGGSVRRIIREASGELSSEITSGNYKPESSIYSLDEFLEQEKEAIERYATSTLLIKFVLSEAKRYAEIIAERKQGTPAYSWWGYILDEVAPVIVMQDILTLGKSKDFLKEEDYQWLVEILPPAYQVMDMEKMAEYFAQFFFLKHARNQDLSSYETSPHLKYLREVSEVLGKSGVVMRFSDEATAHLLEEANKARA